MPDRILIINGHPDPRPERFCAALCDAYAEGADTPEREVRRLNVGEMDLKFVRTTEEFTTGTPEPSIRQAQELIRWADHVVIVHPLWLGGPPAMLKAFLEQVFRYGFALSAPGDKTVGGLLGGRTARLIVTMGMPAAIYRLIFGQAGIRAEGQGVLSLCGFRPVRRSYIGMVEGSAAARRKWLEGVRGWGARGV